jgi:hypothetical protein
MTLVAEYGAQRLQAEGSVDGPGRGPTAGKHELEHGDIPAERARTEETASQPGAAVRAESGAGPRAGDPVDQEATPSLEGPDGPFGAGPEEAVDRPCIEAADAKS